MVAQFGPLPRAFVQRVSVGVSQLELDVLVIRFYGFRADPELLCDPGGAEAGTNQAKHVQLAIGQIRFLGMCCPPIDDLVNGAQCDPRTNIKLSCENSFDGVDHIIQREVVWPQ